MKKSTKKIIGYAFLVIGVVMIIVAVIFIKIVTPVKTSSEKFNKMSPDILNETFELTAKKEEKFCKETDECIYLDPIFSKLKVNKVNNKEVVDFVKKVNSNTNEQSTVMLNSSIDIPECSNLKDIYYHSILPSTFYFLYKNDKYLSITIVRKNFNICSKTSSNISVDSIFYDLENKKVLTNDEIKKVFKTTDVEILNSINEKIDDKIVELNNYYLYYDDNGKKSVIYLNDENFYYNYIK